MRNGRALLVALMAVGCGINEDNWATESAVTTCKVLEHCYLASFNADYDDRNDCVDDIEDDTQDFIDDFLDDCDFDPEEARRCLDAGRKAARSCDDRDIDDLNDDCEDVWDCR